MQHYRYFRPFRYFLQQASGRIFKDNFEGLLLLGYFLEYKFYHMTAF